MTDPRTLSPLDLYTTRNGCGTARIVTLLAVVCVVITAAPGQTVCEGIPRFTGTEMLTSSCWTTSEVSGRVLGVDLSKGSVHVSLTGMSLDKFFDIAVDTSGGFNLNSMPAGDYELLASQGGRILGFRIVVVFPVTSQLIFQLSNEKVSLQPFVRPTPEEIRQAQLSFGPLDWPQLEGPHCIRSKCYVYASDELNR